MAVSILFIFLICMFLAVPFLIATLYRIYYNRKINAELQSGNPKKHITPLSIFFVVVSVEIVGIIILAVLGSYDPDSTNNDLYEEIHGDIYPVSDIQDTLYEGFNGEDIDGYYMECPTQNDCELTIYHNNHDLYDAMPNYIANVKYTGTESIVYYYAEIEVEDEDEDVGTAILKSDACTDNSYLMAVNCDSDCSVTIMLYLFNQEDYDTYLKEVDLNDELIIEKNEEYATDYIEYAIN